MNMKPIIKLCTAALLFLACSYNASASSHREAPLISNDPLADNTDLYAFRSPCDSSKVVLIADYIPFELPQGGPNYYNFGENIRYEIHVDNNAGTPGDDVIYRFTFHSVNEDPTTFFNIRLGKQNLKTTYMLERSTDGGKSFATVITAGVVPPNNIGSRSIDNATVGLGTSYENLISSAVATASTGETVFCGPADDPFFVDLGGAFDVGGFRPVGRDGLAKYNCHAICIQVPIETLQKDHKTTAQASSILDGNFVIGVYASASRKTTSVFDNTTGTYTESGNWIQVSRLGMPLTNEAVIPIGMKDRWNATSPAGDSSFIPYFKNPELGLYMADSLAKGYFGPAVPGLKSLRIQTKSLGAFDFRNGKPGLYSLKGNPALVSTALDPATYGNILLPDDHSPRAVDILPIFYTGVPNLPPYQLATGKPDGSPLSPGKPFINNFLPTLGDYLRLNMAVPVTSRTDTSFSSLGIIEAAVLGLTDAKYNKSAALQFIPNMDGFPNGRRLEDDVTTIELQAVGGVALAAIGLWYDDYKPGVTKSPVTQDLANVLGFNAGVTHNDTTFKWCFPYVQTPWRGFTGPEYSGPKSTVLPVHFLSFTAVKTDKTVLLNWQVANETNSDHYNIEYSQDGIHYAVLTEVASHTGSSYQYTHASPSLSNINYYRIMQVDKDGRTTTSPVQTAKFMFTNVLTVTPNPATTVANVYSTVSNLHLNLYDNVGRKVASQIMKDNNTQINMSSLQSGVYTLVASDKNGKRVDIKKIIKQ